MIFIPGSLSFAKLVMMSSAPAKSAGDARYKSQDPLNSINVAGPIQSGLQSAFFLRQNAINLMFLLFV